MSHEDLSSHFCVDWLKAHEAYFSREETLETADLTGIPRRSIFGPVSYRTLMELGNQGLIAEPPKHRTVIARIRVVIHARLRAVEKLLDQKSMGLPDTAYASRKLAENPRYGEAYGTSQLAKELAAYDQSDPGAARMVIIARSDFAGTSPKLFWHETLVYLLPGAELNQMLILVVAMKSDMPCESELLLFAGMNDNQQCIKSNKIKIKTKANCIISIFDFRLFPKIFQKGI